MLPLCARLAVVIFLGLLQHSTQQNIVESTWIAGLSTLDATATYGTKGVPSKTNSPGSRRDPISWVDSTNGDIWLFGGVGFGSGVSSGFLNDVWRYRTNDSTWTWIAGPPTPSASGTYGIKGVPNPANYPGARADGSAWFDSTNRELWLFGGYGFAATSAAGFLNDLWRFRMNDTMWTWMTGANSINSYGSYGTKGVASASSIPGARADAVAWFNSTNREIWLYGGTGWADTSNGRLNDMWRYRTNDNIWTWVSGSSTSNQVGVYGTNGVASPDNFPGARYDAVAWFDSVDQELWLFGGAAGYVMGSLDHHNDLWRYRMNDSSWTWVSGTSITDSQGIYYLQGEPSLYTLPGGRLNALGWYDAANKELWMFGGEGYDSSPAFGLLNDLWRYRIGDGDWTWMGGSAVKNQAGVYGIKGFPSKLNFPGSRIGSLVWFNSTSRELWMFAGGSIDSSSNTGLFSDTWRISLPTYLSASPSIAPPPESAPAASVPVIAHDAAPVASPLVSPEPVSSGCLGVSTITFAQCINGSWTIVGDFQPTGNLSVSVVTVITGSLIASSNSTLKFTNGAFFNVMGCVKLAGALEVTVQAPTSTVSNQAVPALTFAGDYCEGDPTQFQTVKLNLDGEESCAESSEPQIVYGAQQITVLFSYDRTRCQSDVSAATLTLGGIAGIIVAVLVLLGVAVGVGFWLRRKRMFAKAGKELDLRQQQAL